MTGFTYFIVCLVAIWIGKDGVFFNSCFILEFNLTALNWGKKIENMLMLELCLEVNSQNWHSSLVLIDGAIVNNYLMFDILQ